MLASEFSVADVTNGAAVVAAAALVVAASRRRPLAALGMAALAAPLLYRGISGRWPAWLGAAVSSDDTRVALSGDRGLHVREAVRLELPIDVVYRFWRRLDNLPRFMYHLQEVSEVEGTGRSHWVARGPAGMRVEWDAEIINEVENQTIGWRSLAGSDVVSAGSVNFAAVRGGQGTQVTVHLQYAPPAGRVGAWVAWLMSRAPDQTVREDLRRLKQLLEAGELATADAASRESRR